MNYSASTTSALPSMRAVSMEGNWGGNTDAIKNLPDEYVQRLKNNNVNWIGIKAPIFLPTLTDATVVVKYRPAEDTNYANMYSFADDDLVRAIDSLSKMG